MAQSSGIEYNIAGLDQTLTFFTTLSKELQDLIDSVMNDYATEIEGEAKESVPPPDQINQGPNEGGLLFGSIRANQDEYLVKSVEAGAHYAAYVEFGTRPLVVVPDELKAYAMQFIGAGPPEVPTVAHPYLYPAFAYYIPLFQKDITQRINDELQPPETT